MIGVAGVRVLITTRIADAMPGKLVELRTRLGLTQAQLPDFARILPHEPGRRGLDKFPVAAVVPIATDALTGPVREFATGTEDTYLYRYLIAVFLFARAGNTAAVEAMRDHYSLALREVLLQRRGLGAQGECVLEPETMTESYSDVDADQAQQCIAGVRHDVYYRVTEVLGAAAAPVVPVGPPVQDTGLQP